jgi:hypothetical protein
MESTFLQFKDGSKFKYNENGQVCLATNCTTWAKRLLHNLPLDDYLASESLVPPKDPFTSPNFGTKKRQKKIKESIDNYTANCAYCDRPFEGIWTHQFHGKLVCIGCLKYFKKQVCSFCFQKTVFAEEFIKHSGDKSFIEDYDWTKDFHRSMCNLCSTHLQIYMTYFFPKK